MPVYICISTDVRERANSRNFIALIGLLALVLLIAAPLRAQSAGAAPSPNHAPAAKQSLAGVANFAKVTPYLFRGGQPSHDGFKSLAQLGVNIVIDLRRAKNNAVAREDKEVTADGMTFVSLPWDCRRPSDDIAARFLQIINANPGKKVFIHCHYGVDRTGALIAVYRMAEEGWSSTDAMREMKFFGFNIVHRSWCHALVGFENNFPQQMKSDPRLRITHTSATPNR